MAMQTFDSEPRTSGDSASSRVTTNKVKSKSADWTVNESKDLIRAWGPHYPTKIEPVFGMRYMKGFGIKDSKTMVVYYLKWRNEYKTSNKSSSNLNWELATLGRKGS